jgi:pre-mRNA-processing factor 39
VALRHIAIERHRGNHSAVEELYRKYLSTADSTELRNFYASKYARYLAKVRGDVERAKEILEEALQKDRVNAKLYLQLIDIEYQRPSLNEENIVSVFDRAIASGLTVEQRFIFSQRKLEFLEDFGSNIDSIEHAYDEHQKLSKDVQVIKKHRLSSDLGLDDEPRFSKRNKTDNSSLPSTSHHYTNGDYAAATMPVPVMPPPQPVAPTSGGGTGYDAASYSSYGYAAPSWPGYAAPPPMYDYRQSPWPYPPQYYQPPML